MASGIFLDHSMPYALKQGLSPEARAHQSCADIIGRLPRGYRGAGIQTLVLTLAWQTLYPQTHPLRSGLILFHVT